MGKRKSHCAVGGCEIRYDGRVSFFRFPKGDKHRCNEWLELCGKLELSGKDCDYYYQKLRVCGKHFSDNMFTNHLKDRLLPHATPTYFLPKKTTLDKGSKAQNMDSTFYLQQPADNEDIAQNVYLEPIASCSGMQTPPHIQIVESDDTVTKMLPLKSPIGTQTSQLISNNTPRKRKLRNKVRVQDRKIRKLQQLPPKHEVSLQEFKTLCDKYLPEKFSDLAKVQADLKNKVKKGRRYTEAFKQFALTLYFLSPKSYKFVQKTFILPSKRALQRMTHSINFNVGLNDFVFEAMKLKMANMSDKERMCTLCIDEMSIKSSLFYNLSKDEIIGYHDEGNGKKFLPAQSVMVLMARGIYGNFKQPLGFFFTHTTCKGKVLQNVVEDCILKLATEARVQVRAVVSDQGSNFIELSKNLGISEEKPYFIVNGNKIYYFFDTPHLIKSVRNNLLKYDISFNMQTASWKHISQFYQADKQRSLRLAPKLTDAHLSPTNFERMRVKYAVQILSESVGVAISTYVSLGAMPPEAAGTADFLEKFDKLFDLFNAQRTKGVKKYNLSFMGAEYQISFLNEMSTLLKSIRILDGNGKNVTNKMKCFQGWCTAISALQHLWADLKNEGFSYLLTRRLNQDCLENLFGTVRSQGGNNTNPTPQHFINTMKKIFTMKYLQHSEGSNCVEDLDVILTKIDISKVHEVFESEVEEKEKNLTFDFTDFRELDLVIENALSYVCGYLYRKCMTIHDCQTCRAVKDITLKPSNIFSHLKAYETKSKATFGNLMMPAENFIDFVRTMDRLFVDNFERLSVLPKCGSQLVTLFKEIPFELPCPNFPKDFVCKLFCRTKIFHTLKHANDQIKKTPKKNIKLFKILSL